jgi:hypothetical protein
MGRLRFFKNQTQVGWTIDDIWVATHDTDASDISPAPSTYSMPLPDPQVRTFFPAAEGNQNDWTPLSGIDNALMVDDNPHDTDTTYVESSTTGHIDLYTYAAHAATAQGLQASWMSCNVKDTTSGSPNMIFRTRHATNEEPFGSEDTTNTGYEQKGIRVRRDVGATPSAIPLTITNGDAETGTLSGWTVTGDTLTAQSVDSTGGPTAGESASLNWFAFDNDGDYGASGLEARVYQDISVATDAIPEADIDAGNLTCELTVYSYQTSGSSEFVINVTFIDDDGNFILRARTQFDNPGASWVQRTSGAVQIPAHTRTIRLEFGAVDGGATVNIFGDTVEATVSYINNLDEFTPTESNAAEFGIELT